MKKSDEIGISWEIGSSSKKSRNHQGNHEIMKSCTLNWPVSDPSGHRGRQYSAVLPKFWIQKAYRRTEASDKGVVARRACYYYQLVAIKACALLPCVSLLLGVL